MPIFRFVCSFKYFLWLMLVLTSDSFIVALKKIDSVEKNRVYIGENIIPVSSTFKDGFYLFLKK